MVTLVLIVLVDDDDQHKTNHNNNNHVVVVVVVVSLSLEPLEFVRKTVQYANHHYPERAHCIFLVNVPGWFSWIYKMLKPLIHENTQKKIKILSRKEVLDGLKEHIDVSQVSHVVVVDQLAYFNFLL